MGYLSPIRMQAVDIQNWFGDAGRESGRAASWSIGAVVALTLDHEIVALEERHQRLKQQHKQSEARRRTRESRRARQDAGHRWDLVGAVVLARVEPGKLEESLLRGRLEGGVTRGERLQRRAVSRRLLVGPRYSMR
jgi:hypothetical protein